MSTSSEKDDLQSYLSAHKKSNSHNKHSNSRTQEEIDWTKLMDSAVHDDQLDPELEVDAGLYCNYGDSSDDTDIDMFLKTSANKHSTLHNDDMANSLETYKLPKLRPDNERTESPRQTSSKQSRLRKRSIGGDPNLHVVSDLDASATSDIDISSSTTISDPSQSEKMPSIQQQGIYTVKNDSVSVSESAPLVDKVRNASEIILSLSEQDPGSVVHVGGGFKQGIKGQTTSEVTGILSETISLSEPVRLNHNVFSIETSDPVFSEDERGVTNLRATESEECTETHSFSESFGQVNMVNIHTVDELLPDVSSTSDKVRKGEKTVSVGTSRTKSHSNNTIGSVHTSVAVSDTGKPNQEKTLGNKNTFKFSASTQSNNQKKATHNSSGNADGGESLIENGSNGEDYSYSLDGDFEPQTVTDLATSGTESITRNDEREVSTSEDETEVDVTYSEVPKTESVGRNTNLESSSFSDENLNRSKQTETDHSQVSASTSSKEEPPISTRPHDRTSQRDASVQTCLPSQHTDIHSAYHRPPLGGQYCRDYLTPTPILPHVLSAGTLEALASYPPGSIVFNDMLRTQLILTRQSIESTKQLVDNICRSTASDYHYTTLEDTRAYIDKHRPKVLTLTEAKRTAKTNRK